MKKRLVHIDIAKGLGIVFIVLGHSWFSRFTGLNEIIFSFHVPLFFLLSGIFLNVSEGIKKSFINKFSSIMKPYFLVLIFLGFVYVIIGRKTSLEFLEYLFYISYGTGEMIPYVAMWFLPSLFVTYMYSMVVIKYVSIRYLYIYLIAFLIIGFMIMDNFRPLFIEVFNRTNIYALPLSVDIVFVTSFYFLLGYLFRNEIKDEEFNFVQFIISAIIFIYLHYTYDYSMDLNVRRYDDLFISTLLAISGSLIIIQVSRLLRNLNYFNRLFIELGKASLFILIFHLSFMRNSEKMLHDLLQSQFLVAVLSIMLSILISYIIYLVVNKYSYLKIIFYKTK